jgi:hypothetical protein
MQTVRSATVNVEKPVIGGPRRRLIDVVRASGANVEDDRELIGRDDAIKRPHHRIGGFGVVGTDSLSPRISLDQ